MESSCATDDLTMWLNHRPVSMLLSTIWLNVFNRIFCNGKARNAAMLRLASYPGMRNLMVPATAAFGNLALTELSFVSNPPKPETARARGQWLQLRSGNGLPGWF